MGRATNLSRSHAYSYCIGTGNVCSIRTPRPSLRARRTLHADFPARTALFAKDVAVVMVAGPSLAPVKCDRGQLEQIVMNLAINARDAMPRGGTFTLETANVELDAHEARRSRAPKAGSYVVLTVTDTGTGMTPEV